VIESVAVIRFGMLLPALLLAVFGVAHFQNGLALDAAIPVPVYMVQGAKLSARAYKNANAALADASPRNGLAMIIRGETAMHAGHSQREAVALLRQGLIQAPASARGWTLLAEELRTIDAHKAGAALGQALVLAPHDYYLAAARVYDAGLLWDFLDTETRQLAISQTRLLWEEPVLRAGVVPLAQTGVGAAQFSRSLSPDEIRLLNRKLARAQRGVR